MNDQFALNPYHSNVFFWPPWKYWGKGDQKETLERNGLNYFRWKFKLKIPQHFCQCYMGLFIVNFEKISLIVLAYLMLTSNILLHIVPSCEIIVSSISENVAGCKIFWYHFCQLHHIVFNLSLYISFSFLYNFRILQIALKTYRIKYDTKLNVQENLSVVVKQRKIGLNFFSLIVFILFCKI